VLSSAGFRIAIEKNVWLKIAVCRLIFKSERKRSSFSSSFSAMETEIEIVEEANPPFNFGGSGSDQVEAGLNSVDKIEKFDKNVSGSVSGSHLLLFSDDD
jgi:hypothetical protein